MLLKCQQHVKQRWFIPKLLQDVWDLSAMKPRIPFRLCTSADLMMETLQKCIIICRLHAPLTSYSMCVLWAEQTSVFFFLQQPPHELQGSWALCVAHGHCMLNNKLRQFLVEFLVEQPGLTCSVVNMFPTALLYQHLGHLISLQVAESQFCIWA